ncbi:MAG: ATP-binding cassette domain-containing protein [Acidobacteria bacterium]|nr:ATP-binding cassette domain-containing protein [Acidobacteriota bacterium]
MIELEHVVKIYDEKVVLDDVNFTVKKGETKIILGGSGSGKSTILKLILGLERPDSGRVIIDGEDITRMNQRDLMRVRQNIGMVFQEGALFDSLTVRENVGYRLYESSAASEAEIEETVRRLLGFVDLEEAIDQMPAELSGGMKRRVGIARAMVGNPKILLYDEPTAGLDPITARTILELTIKLRDLEGVTSIFVTHDLKAARIIASEFVVVEPPGKIRFQKQDENLCLINIDFVMLKEGTIVFEGSLAELERWNDPYIQRFVG